MGRSNKAILVWIVCIYFSTYNAYYMVDAYIYRNEQCLGTRRFTTIKTLENYVKYILPRVSGLGKYYYVIKNNYAGINVK